MFGYLMEKEVKAVDKVLNDIKRPFTAIMGGSKVSSKIEIIENLLNKVDNLIIAGGMTYTFTKAMGGKIGISICEDDKLDLALDLMKKAKEKGVNLYWLLTLKLLTLSLTMQILNSVRLTKFLMVGKVLISVLKLKKSSLTLSKSLRLSFGTVRQVYLNSITLLTVHVQ